MTPIHEKSAFYDVASFKAGQTSLKSVELEELSDVSGQTMLHLQCHFGLDTLSWARLGAKVTGVDFSPKAIALARNLSAEIGVEARFICANVYELPDSLTEQFDIIFTSYGVLCWLPDLTRWAQIIAHYLKPGGVFYIVEFHPFFSMLDETGVTLKYPYFPSPEPLRFEGEGDYADPSASIHHASYEWPHPLSEVINTLLAAGLRLEYIHEFPFSSYPTAPSLEEFEPGKSRLRQAKVTPPLMFSIRATR